MSFKELPLKVPMLATPVWMWASKTGQEKLSMNAPLKNPRENGWCKCLTLKQFEFTGFPPYLAETYYRGQPNAIRWDWLYHLLILIRGSQSGSGRRKTGLWVSEILKLFLFPWINLGNIETNVSKFYIFKKQNAIQKLSVFCWLSGRRVSWLCKF